MPSRRRLQQLPWPSLLASSRPGPRSPPPPHPRQLRRRKPRLHQTAGWSACPSSPAAPTPAKPGGRGNQGSWRRRRPSRHLRRMCPRNRPSPNHHRAIPNRSPMPRHRIRRSSLRRRRQPRMNLPLVLLPPPVTSRPPAPPADRTGTALLTGPARPPSWLPLPLPVAGVLAGRPSGPSPWARCWWAPPPEPSPGGTGTGTGSGRTEPGCVPRRPAPWLSEV